MLKRIIIVLIFLTILSSNFSVYSQTKPLSDRYIAKQIEKEAEDGTVIVVSLLQNIDSYKLGFSAVFQEGTSIYPSNAKSQVKEAWLPYEIKLKDSDKVLCYMKVQDFETAVGNDTTALTFKVHKKYEYGTLYDIFCGPLPYEEYQYPSKKIMTHGKDDKYYYGNGYDDIVQHTFLWLDNENPEYNEIFTNTPMILNELTGFLLSTNAPNYFNNRHKDDRKSFYEHLKEPYRYIIGLEVTKCELLLKDDRWFILSDNIMGALELLVENEDSEGLALKKRVDVLLEFYNEYFTRNLIYDFAKDIVFRINFRNFESKYNKPITTMEEREEYIKWIENDRIISQYEQPITTQEELDTYLEWLKIYYTPYTMNSFYLRDRVQRETRVNPTYLNINIIDNGPLVDPYGTEFKFELTDTGYKVTSAGYDKKFGTEDDLSRSFKGVKWQ